MERMTDPAADHAPGLVKVLRGAPEPDETAALLTVLAALRGARPGPQPAPAPAPDRPTWRPFAGHSGGGWGQS